MPNLSLCDDLALSSQSSNLFVIGCWIRPVPARPGLWTTHRRGPFTFDIPSHQEFGPGPACGKKNKYIAMLQHLISLYSIVYYIYMRRILYVRLRANIQCKYTIAKYIRNIQHIKQIYQTISKGMKWYTKYINIYQNLWIYVFYRCHIEQNGEDISEMQNN